MITIKGKKLDDPELIKNIGGKICDYYIFSDLHEGDGDDDDDDDDHGSDVAPAA